MEFIWGCATAAAQIEGAYNEDGKSLSIWDGHSMFRHFITDNTTTEFSVDSYHKYKEDIKLIKELGCKAYRFSIAWTRICPNKDMKINSTGIEHYRNVCKECLENGITPYVTLYHWDAPEWLYESDMWLSGEILKYFGTYCEAVVSNLSDLVENFIVVNEPPCVADILGGNIIGKTYSRKETLQIIHNILLAVGIGGKIVKKYNKKLGCAHNPCGIVPDTNKDIEAARKAFLAIDERFVYSASLYLDAIIYGKYPDEYFTYFKKEELPDIKEGDMDIIKSDIDFIGLNLYEAIRVKKSDNEKGFEMLEPRNNLRTLMNWPVVPETLYYVPKLIYERYNKPIFITENGCSYPMDEEDKRCDFIRDYLSCLLQAKKDGVDIRGYFHWSLIDNFEWLKGYRQRFGIVDKDRNKKQGYYVYQDIIKNNK